MTTTKATDKERKPLAQPKKPLGRPQKPLARPQKPPFSHKEKDNELRL